MKKTVLITGASRGIGSAISIKFAKEGYDMCIISKSGGENMDKMVSILSGYGVKVYPYTCDVSDNAAVSTCIDDAREKLGTISYVINNAGISYTGLLQDMSYDEFDLIIRTNLYSVFNTTSKLIPDMISKKEGSIVNISSIWGSHGASCEVAYCASKSGIDGYTRALAKELAPSNIRVNAVAPGVIDTDMNSHLSPEELAALTEEIPAGRLGTPKDIADVVFDIATNHPYMTGQVITVDGGYTS